jgi:hypothetical protein
MRTRLAIIATGAMLLAPAPALAASCVAAHTGTWGTAGTWTACNGGAPGAADTATVGAGVTITLTQNVTDAGLTLDGGTLDTGGSTLTSTGVVTITANGGTIQGGGAVTTQGVGGTLLIGGPLTETDVDVTAAGATSWTAGALTLTGASLTPSGGMTVSADVAETGDDTSNLAIGGGLTVSASHHVSLGGPTTFGNGTVAIGDGRLDVANAAGAAHQITIGGGTFDLTGGALTVTQRLGSTGSRSGTAVIDDASLTIQTGAVVLLAATTVSNGATVSTAATFDGGAVTVDGGAGASPTTITGTGEFRSTTPDGTMTTVDGGTAGLDIAGPGLFTLNGSGTASVRVAGTISITSGTYLSVAVPTTIDGATLNYIANGGSSTIVRVTGTTLTLTGPIQTTGAGRLSLDATSVLSKPATDPGSIGLIWTLTCTAGSEIHADGGVLQAPLSGQPIVHIGSGAEFSNTGTSALGDGTTIDGAGIYGIAAGKSTSATFVAGTLAPALLEIGGNAVFTVHGRTGQVNLSRIIVSNGGTLSFLTQTGDPSLLLQATTIVLHGGTIAGDVNTTLDVTGTTTVDSGDVGVRLTSHGITTLSGDATVDAAWTIPTGVTLSTASGTFVTGVGRIVLGGVLHPAGDLELAGLEIASGGSYAIAGETISIALGVGSLHVDAGGNLSGHGTIQASLSNDGGTVALSGTTTITGSLTNTGTGFASTGTLHVGGDVTNAGTLTTTGSLGVTGAFADTGGTLDLGGSGDVGGAFTSTGGTVLLHHGSLHVHGAYSQDATSTLSAGIRSATDFDATTVDGALTLDGTFHDTTAAAAYDPVPGTMIRIITAAAPPTGTFAAFTAPLLDGRSWYVPDYTSSPVTLAIHYTIPSLHPNGDPVVSGDRHAGKTLTCMPGRWDDRPLSFTYAWTIGGVPGPAGHTYVVKATDGGLAVSCTVTATNPAGSTDAPSAAVTIAPTADVAPTVGPGTPVLGGAFTCSTGDWLGSTATTIAWLRDGHAIAGATAAMYHVGLHDLGHVLSCRVHATGPGGATDATSAATRIRAGVSASGKPKLDARNRLTLKLACLSSEGGCTGTVTLFAKGRSVGSAHFSMTGSRSVRITLSRTFAAKLRASHRASTGMSISYTNHAGAQRSYTLTLVLTA